MARVDRKLRARIIRQCEKAKAAGFEIRRHTWLRRPQEGYTVRACCALGSFFFDAAEMPYDIDSASQKEIGVCHSFHAGFVGGFDNNDAAYHYFRGLAASKYREGYALGQSVARAVL